jgi:hypothetical protein
MVLIEFILLSLDMANNLMWSEAIAVFNAIPLVTMKQ